MKTRMLTDNQKNERLHSLDALRGFDMLWISGGEHLIVALAALTGWSFFEWAAKHMHHVEWNGFAFYDMIFPLFLFIAGISLPISLNKRLERGETRPKIYRHLVQRLVLLIVFGILYNGLLRDGFHDIRVASVLGRIGAAWFFAAILVMNSSIRWQIIWCLGLLLIYWALLTLVPVPGYGPGVLTPEGSLVGYIDRMLMPGKLYLGVHDPEGLLATMPAISTALLGVFTSYFIRFTIEKIRPLNKALMLIGAGIILVLLGYGWGLSFPVNKNLWTSSFVFVAGGYSIIFFGLFYLIIDVWKIKGWSFFFIVIGMNSITIYMLQAGIINFSSMRNFFFGSIIGLFNENWQPVISSLGYIACVWTFLYILYRKRVFLRV